MGQVHFDAIRGTFPTTVFAPLITADPNKQVKLLIVFTLF